jgi:hypothetical protein
MRGLNKMPTYHPEIRRWIDRARDQQKPYSYVLIDQRRLELLSATGYFNEHFVVSDIISNNGFIKWIIINRSVRIPIKRRLITKLNAKFDFGFAKWDPSDPNVRPECARPEFSISRTSPNTKYYSSKETTCHFNIIADGEECIETKIFVESAAIRDYLESKFVCRR